ncbi:MAG: tetratricopeptide repeat protein [Acidobacteria bacterium]|nr:tetratricopeptide repeat protein [Acidobacteriota bacterium]
MKSRREMLEEFVAADPNDSFSRYALALELEKAERADEAIAQLQEVLARDESYVAAYYHLGRMLAKAGKDAEALGVYQRGIEAASKAGDQKTRSEIQEAIEML